MITVFDTSHPISSRGLPPYHIHKLYLALSAQSSSSIDDSKLMNSHFNTHLKFTHQQSALCATLQFETNMEAIIGYGTQYVIAP